MCGNRFTFEFEGRLESRVSWRDNPYYFSSLQVTKILPLHDGCVNSICWDENGEYLLSGSDDRRICIVRMFPDFYEVIHFWSLTKLQEVKNNVVFSQKLPADSNIFKATFLPQTNNCQVIVGFKCGCVLVVRTDAPLASRVQTAYCHKYAVYDILTFPDHPTCFMTLSHDQSVVFFDVRQPFDFLRSRSVCNQRCSYSDSPCFMKTGSGSAGWAQMRFQFPVTAGDVHPLDSSRQVALACSDGFVRLFDLRRFAQLGVSASGESSQPLPHQITRPLGLPAQVAERRAIRLDYGPAHITSVQFEPFYPSTGIRFPTPVGHRDVFHRSGFGARHLLVSHMYAPVFMFDLARSESREEPDTKTIDWLSDFQPAGERSTLGESSTPNSNDTQPNMSANVNFNSDIRIALAFFRWLESQRAQRFAARDQQSEEAEPSDRPSVNRRADESSGDQEPDRANTNDPSEASNSETVSPFELLTDEYVAKVLASTARARQQMIYRGRRSCRTVIKSAVFWGRDHILSGSECGHVIAWNRWSGAPVCAIKADSSVVNRIAPHPSLPLFACSGIDRTVKVVEPSPSLYQMEDYNDGDFADGYANTVKQQELETAKLCEENSAYMIESLRSSSLHLDRLARLRTGQVIRNILRRLGITASRSGEDSDPPDQSAP
ncbi:WD domain G-beta repeat protein [Paragonimus heterotremus]|uniref:WD domain G-beta repeat protein n=1 Tax=Paragonimus heterotremus TaxID=100268 RepID=A0A8J4WXS6_9TREM|nr:WD domain G-beta repeat protein [Paragonimus heterotremus]